MKKWWLSFCDDCLPEGSQFLGACLVEADDFGLAVAKASSLGINPGGEVLGASPDDEAAAIVPARWHNRLLTRAECEEMDKEVLALQDATGVSVPYEPEMKFACAKHNEVMK